MDRNATRTVRLLLLACAGAMLLFAGGYQFGKSLAKSEARVATVAPAPR